MDTGEDENTSALDEPMVSGEDDTGLADRADLEKLPGDTTNYKGWLKAGVWASSLWQAAFALIYFVYIIMQLNTLSAFNLAAVYTAFMGFFYLIVVGVAIAFPSTIRDKFENAATFIFFFTVTYVITVAWMWTFFVRNPTFSIHHDHTHSPLPLTPAFLPYVGLAVWIIFSTLFFLMFAFALLSQKISSANAVKMQWSGLEKSRFGVSNTVMQLFGFLALAAGILYGMFQFFWVLGFDTGTLVGPLTLYIIYSVCWLIQGLAYFSIWWYMNTPVVTSASGMVSGANRLLRNVFGGHWEEIDGVQFFMAIFFAINFGFWVRIWTVDHVEYTSRLKFDGPPTTVFFSLVANAIISTACVPLFGYYIATFVCYTQYVIGTDTSYSIFQVGYKSILSIVGSSGVSVKTRLENGRVREEKFEQAKGWINRTLLFIFVMGLLFTIGTTIVVLIDLVNGGSDPNSGHYLNARFRNWEWTIFFVTGFFWLVYFFYAFFSAVNMYRRTGTATGYRNALVMCIYGRPLITYGLVIFINDFAAGWVYNKHNIGGKIPMVLTTDPAAPLSVIYWAVLIIYFLSFVAAVLSFKDMLSGLLGLMFVMSESTTVKLEGLYNEQKIA